MSAPSKTVHPELLLLSGGVESGTLLHQLRGRAVTALSVDYGQRAADQETRHARALCARLGIPWQGLDLRCLGAAFRAGQPHALHVPLPHRNFPLLALTVSWAAQQGIQRVYLALNRDDAAQHPSASSGFLTGLRAAVAALAGPDIDTPLIDRDKAEVVRLGQRLGVDFAATYSCLLGHPLHCGACPQCRSRRAAFAAAGVAEPVGFYRSGA